MKPSLPTQLLFAGTGENHDDYKTLKGSAGKKKVKGWSCIKGLKKGDRVMIYNVAPHKAIVAVATALKDSEPGDYWPFETDLGDIRMLEPEISRDEIRLLLPNWPWAKATRGRTRIPPEFAEQLWARAEQGAPALMPVPVAISSNGAGFGNPETNPLVEKAAVDKVTALLKKRGYRVKSREIDKIGYDLDAFKGRQELHIEVKGISGTKLSFPITQGELIPAGSDPLFRLFAVTSAMTDKAKIHEFTGSEFLAEFDCTPISYMARKKK